MDADDREFWQSGTDFRQAKFGVNQSGEQQMFTGDGIVDPVPCYFTQVKDLQQLEAAMMKLQHDGIVRISKSTGFQPRLGQVIRLIDARAGGGDLTVKFDEFGHSGFNSEFVIGVGNLFK